MLRISTLNGHTRMSTQELLQQIEQAVANGETDFHISATGQHDIGGPLWNREGLPLRFTITNPGQRVGSMCLPATTVIVDGPAPADVGWLNAGGIITVRGDAGDTAAHCAAGGKIYIGGRAGTRSGSLMKHDPEHEPPQLWILDSTGSFSFEFMGGGKAVICGHNSQTLPSVLGDRPCVGMVGGEVFFRGPAPELPPDVCLKELDQEDIEWLDHGLDDFLDAIGKSKLKRELSFWKHWRKLVPNDKHKSTSLPDIKEFHKTKWFPGGLFGDVLKDDQRVAHLVNSGDNRLRQPIWENYEDKCVDCRLCLKICPKGAVHRRPHGDNPEKFVYSVNSDRCIGCSFCAAICPQKIWKMKTMTK